MTIWNEQRIAYSPELLITLMSEYASSMSETKEEFPLLVPCVKYFTGMVALDCFSELVPRAQNASKKKVLKNIAQICIEYPREYRMLEESLSEALLLGQSIGVLTIDGITVKPGRKIYSTRRDKLSEVDRMKKWTSWMLNKKNSELVLTEMGVSYAV